MFSNLNFMPTVKVPFSHIFFGPEIFQTIYTCYIISILWLWLKYKNKANLRDLIAATGLVISNWIQIVDFSACVVVKFDGWPRKAIGHFLYTTSSFVHHFKSIGEVKLELQSGNAQLGSKLVIFLSCVTLKFDGWLRKTTEHLFYTT